MNYKVIVYRIYKYKGKVERDCTYNDFSTLKRALNRLTEIVYHYQNLYKNVGDKLEYSFEIYLYDDNGQEYFNVIIN